MKCPNCGAEVAPNSNCEYCGAYVEEAANHAKDFINQRMMSAGKNIVRMVLFVVIFLTIILVIGLVGFSKLADKAFSDNSDYESSHGGFTTESDVGDIRSLTDAEGIVRSYSYDGRMDVEYDGEIYSTKLKDEVFLKWTEETGRNITGVGIEFSTDANGDVTEIAMLSATFYVLAEQDNTYLILREEDVFVATSKPLLEQGYFYEGYCTYPKVNVHSALTTDVSGQMLMDPTCDEKRELSTADFYTDEEVVVWQIRMGTEWYYCSKELYDFCEEGTRIEADVYRVSDMEILYME
ncbi:MAG: zinc ribbon domain-containing protein [Lachnospiraceae bacterium]|nr:zinc ribbon domain-containing protein [Lachnospiraceae bacterium]